MTKAKNKDVSLKALSKNLNSLSINLDNDFKRYQAKLNKKPNLSFREREWEYFIEAGDILWTLFDSYYFHLDSKLQNIIGDCKSEDRSSYNPNSAKGKTFKNVCLKWLDNFERIKKTKGHPHSYSFGMKKIAEYVDQIAAKKLVQ